jgi:hypothetical protein
VQSRYGSEAAFQQALARYGITREQFNAHFQWQIAVLQFTEMRFQTTTLAPAPQGQAERSAPGAAPGGQPAQPSLDERLGEWLENARQRTRVNFMPEAFR